MKRMILIMLLCSVIMNAFAQKVMIKGCILDATNQEAMEFANIILQTTDSAFVSGTTSDIKGQFTLAQINPGDYQITVSTLGYEPQTIELQKVTQNVDLGNINMDNSSVKLEEVTVNGSNMSSRSDRKVVFPTTKQIEASNNGITLLQQLMLPKIKINHLDNTVSVPGNGEVQLRINGVKVETQEIIALQPVDIIRIEYHDNPGLRYGNAEVVLDYIVHRPETGGNINIDLRNGVNALWGNDQLSAKINHKKSEFAINYNINPRDFYDVYRDNEEHFYFADGTSLKRKEEGEPGRLDLYWQNLNLNYSYQEPDKYLFNATLRYSNNDQSHIDYIGKLYNLDQSNDIVHMQDKSKEKNNRPALDLYYQRNLKHEQTLVFNLVGTYNKSQSERIYQESRNEQLLTDIHNRTEGKKYSIIGEAIYEKKLGKNRLSTGLKYEQSFSDNVYRNGHETNTKMNQSDSYTYAEWSGKVKKLDYTLGVGVSRYYFKQDGADKSYSYYTFRPKITLQYNLTDQSFLRLNGSAYRVAPSLSYLSDVEMVVDSMQIQRGNPNLKPYMRYNLYLTYEIKKGLFYNSTWAGYEYCPDAIADEKMIEGDKFIQTWKNQKDWQRIAARSTFRIGPIKDILQFSATGGVNHYKSNGNTYRHRYTNWYYNGEVSANYKKFLFLLGIESNWNWFWGETLSGGENIHYCMAKYNLKNLSFGLSMFNPFSDNYRVVAENWSKHASYKRAGYVNESSHLLMVHFSYNFSFGRKFSATQKRVHNSDTDSGVMSSGK
ncbi:MAG: TonB-dependent receptor [Massilibacteroides sp.]|nr:TonB-dependent receptor [Massilibacteroides sp.]MDD3062245.1 TonB-dependent receptor [Massilibacteroides sp.]MDD4114016.1 TonB-dependent receptor [Massilibacteroides sp.]MDD4660018.1 TonB-dependent receptor [Massilibacteroides sp.]